MVELALGFHAAETHHVVIDDPIIIVENNLPSPLSDNEVDDQKTIFDDIQVDYLKDNLAVKLNSDDPVVDNKSTASAESSEMEMIALGLNVDADDSEVSNETHGDDDDQIFDYNNSFPAQFGNAVEQVEKKNSISEIKEVKPSFVDILKLNPNLSFQEKIRKRVITSVPVMTKSNNSNNNNAKAISQFAVDKAAQPEGKPAVAVDGAAIRSAEKKVEEESNSKELIQHKIENIEAVCQEAMHVYESAASDLKAMRVLLEAKKAEISKSKSLLERLRQSEDVEDVLGKESDPKMVSLVDGMKVTLDVLRSSGVGIYDLDWKELANELLQPLRIEAVLLKEDIRKAEGFANASEKSYETKTEELEVLKTQLMEAESVLGETKGELMTLNPKEFSEDELKEDLKPDEGDQNEAKVETDPLCIGQMDLGHQVKEPYKEDVGSNLEKDVENENIEQTVKFVYKCNTDKASMLEDRCGSEKSRETEDSSTETGQTVESMDMWNTDKTSEPDDGWNLDKTTGNFEEDICIKQILKREADGYKSEQAMESEYGWNDKELDDVSVDVLAEDSRKQDEVDDKLEWSAMELVEDKNARKQKSKTSQNKKKKQKQREKKAQAIAAELREQEGDGACMELPYQFCLVLTALCLLGIMFLVWYTGFTSIRP